MNFRIEILTITISDLATPSAGKKLVSESGVYREMIGKYERGDAVPSIEAAKKIADSFGLSLGFSLS